MKRRLVFTLGTMALCAFLGAFLTHAQSRPAFDVASLKPSPPSTSDRININLGTARHGVVTLSNTCLADCLRFAYSITNNEQIAGPDWIKDKSVRFDIEGKAAPDTPLPVLREMLQTLLVERFKLAYHIAQKNMSYVALVVGKNGPKLEKAIDDSEDGHGSYLIGKINTNRVTIATLATVLSRYVGETIVNMTGLTGWYQVKLDWAQELPQTLRGAEGEPPAVAEPVAGPTIYSAVEAQLGLRLEHRKGALDVITIDHAERTPAGN
jgi:uncharacterized protein (TIGR03435 family)